MKDGTKLKIKRVNKKEVQLKQTAGAAVILPEQGGFNLCQNWEHNLKELKAWPSTICSEGGPASCSSLPPKITFIDFPLIISSWYRIKFACWIVDSRGATSYLYCRGSQLTIGEQSVSVILGDPIPKCLAHWNKVWQLTVTATLLRRG